MVGAIVLVQISEEWPHGVGIPGLSGILLCSDPERGEFGAMDAEHLPHLHLLVYAPFALAPDNTPVLLAHGGGVSDSRPTISLPISARR